VANFVLFCDLDEVCEFVVYASITWNYPYIIIIIIIIRNLYSAIMPLGGYRGAGGTGR